MNDTRRTIQIAFYLSVPVMLGYIFMGMSFGILLYNKGYHFLWAVFMSIIIYSGSAQFIAIDFLSPGVNLVNAAMICFFVSIRHMVYGIAMLDTFKTMGNKKPYMIYGLSDETFSLICTDRFPPGVDEKLCRFFITILNQSYWVIGSAIGGLIGGVFPFQTKGIDFMMTALFTVTFIDQWKTTKNHIPAVTGVVVTIICLLLFGKDQFLFPAMILIGIILTIVRRHIEPSFQPKKEEGTI